MSAAKRAHLAREERQRESVPEAISLLEDAANALTNAGIHPRLVERIDTYLRWSKR